MVVTKSVTFYIFNHEFFDHASTQEKFRQPQQHQRATDRRCDTDDISYIADVFNVVRSDGVRQINIKYIRLPRAQTLSEQQCFDVWQPRRAADTSTN